MDAVPSTTEITVTQPSCRVGLPDAPTIVDVRVDDGVAADPRLPPESYRRPYRQAPARQRQDARLRQPWR
jgi:hypothetical protein